MANVEAWFVEHQAQLFRYLCRAVGHAETARDLTQDVFLRATRSGAAVPDGAEARRWLFTIARNLALDHHRRERGQGERGQTPGERGLTPISRGLTPFSASSPSQETALVVNEALAALPELDRDVFLMRETAGLSYVEIAGICDLTPEAVRSRIHRARLALRERLGGEIRSRRGAAAPKPSRKP